MDPLFTSFFIMHKQLHKNNIRSGALVMKLHKIIRGWLEIILLSLLIAT